MQGRGAHASLFFFSPSPICPRTVPLLSHFNSLTGYTGRNLRASTPKTQSNQQTLIWQSFCEKERARATWGLETSAAHGLCSARTGTLHVNSHGAVSSNGYRKQSETSILTFGLDKISFQITSLLFPPPPRAERARERKRETLAKPPSHASSAPQAAASRHKPPNHGSSNLATRPTNSPYASSPSSPSRRRLNIARRRRPAIPLAHPPPTSQDPRLLQQRALATSPLLRRSQSASPRRSRSRWRPGAAPRLGRGRGGLGL